MANMSETTQQELDITQLASYLSQAENALECADRLYKLALPNGTRFYQIDIQEIRRYVTKARDAIRRECEAIDKNEVAEPLSDVPVDPFAGVPAGKLLSAAFDRYQDNKNAEYASRKDLSLSTLLQWSYTDLRNAANRMFIDRMEAAEKNE